MHTWYICQRNQMSVAPSCFMLLAQEENRRVVDFMRALGIILVICFHVVVGLTTLLKTDALHRYIDAMPFGRSLALQPLHWISQRSK